MKAAKFSITGHTGYSGPPDMARNNSAIMEGDGHGSRNGEFGIPDGADNGDNGGNHGNVVIVAGNGGHGVNNLDPGAIVDRVLADLPEPSRHHIFPEVEENSVAGLVLC